jgi:subtilisin family serine protease
MLWLVLPLLAQSSFADAGKWRWVNLRTSPHAARVQSAAMSGPDYAVADRVLVGVNPSTSAASTASALAVVGGSVSARLAHGRVLVVELPAGSDVAGAVASLQGKPGVAYAEPDRRVWLCGPAVVSASMPVRGPWLSALTRAVLPAAIPTDPEYVNQPHLPQIKAPGAWDIGTGSSRVVIAFVDSGIDPDHPDLSDRIWTNPGEVPGNGRDDDLNGFVDDVHGWNFYDDNNDVEARPVAGASNEQVSHGTLGASLAAAAANGWGTVGVAWQATIMPVKIFSHDGDTAVSTVIRAMQYAVDNGCDIMNLSIGAGYESSFSPPIVDLYNRGGLTVAAGGNESQQLTATKATWVSPACNNGLAGRELIDNMVLGVGGVDSLDRKASWSNYDATSSSNFIEVFAPGLNIHGAGVYYPSVSGFGSYFTNNSGTSFAAPLVSGLCALLLGQDPSRKGADLIRIIRSNCDNIDAKNPGYAGKLGAGRINCARAMGADVPPAPPTSVQAVDTAGDSGGSVTLTWTKSSDDGGGSGAVTGYVVSRAEGALPASVSGVWTDIATLAAGTALYVDATTADGVDYYYRVAAIDGTHRVESEAVGPVQSRDDTAPDRIDTLTVQDHPLDSGGAIDLDWSGYVGAPDIAIFRIYRSSRAFTSVAGKTPYVTLTNPSARSYTDTGVVDGADYYYAITAVDDHGNERKDVRAAGPVQSFANGAITFGAGTRMIATAVAPADEDLATFLGLSPAAFRAARWDPTTAAYRTYAAGSGSDLLKARLGRGYWLNLSAGHTFTPSGAAAPAGDFSVDVVPGWQQLGNPFFGPLDFSLSTVTYGGTVMDIFSAGDAGILRSYAWTYNATTGDYELVHPDFGLKAQVPPWTGLWVLADKACTLTFVRPSSAASIAAARTRTASADPDAWVVQLQARGDNSVDAANYLGVKSSANGVVSPPRSDGGVELAFTDAPGLSPGAYATSFYASARQSMFWDLRVTWARSQSAIEVQWPDLSTVPSGLSLILTDLDTGRRVSMRHQAGYRFTPTASTGTRHLRVEARAAGGAVRISALSSAPTGAGGAQVVFTLSSDAMCDVTILNIAGRPVRVVETGGVHGAGVNTVTWDGRSSAGTAVPSGQYLLRVTARAEDGTAATALRLMRVGR